MNRADRRWVADIDRRVKLLMEKLRGFDLFSNTLDSPAYYSWLGRLKTLEEAAETHCKECGQKLKKGRKACTKSSS